MLRVSEKNSEERTHGFETPSRGACRHLWKCCQEHQAFFRLMATGPPPLSPYSRFRSYSPPTSEKHHPGSIRRNPQPAFQRAPSRRAQRRVVEGQEMVGPFVETPAIDRNITINSSNCSAPRHINNSSPRSTRSAPWTQSQPRGLYTSSSPRSVRSAGTAPAVSSIFSLLYCLISTVLSPSPLLSSFIEIYYRLPGHFLPFYNLFYCHLMALGYPRWRISPEIN